MYSSSNSTDLPSVDQSKVVQTHLSNGGEPNDAGTLTFNQSASRMATPAIDSHEGALIRESIATILNSLQQPSPIPGLTAGGFNIFPPEQSEGNQICSTVAMNLPQTTMVPCSSAFKGSFPNLSNFCTGGSGSFNSQGFINQTVALENAYRSAFKPVFPRVPCPVTESTSRGSLNGGSHKSSGPPLIDPNAFLANPTLCHLLNKPLTQESTLSPLELSSLARKLRVPSHAQQQSTYHSLLSMHEASQRNIKHTGLEFNRGSANQFPNFSQYPLQQTLFPSSILHTDKSNHLSPQSGGSVNNYPLSNVLIPPGGKSSSSLSPISPRYRSVPYSINHSPSPRHQNANYTNIWLSPNTAKCSPQSTNSDGGSNNCNPQSNTSSFDTSTLVRLVTSHLISSEGSGKNSGKCGSSASTVSTDDEMISPNGDHPLDFSSRGPYNLNNGALGLNGLKFTADRKGGATFDGTTVLCQVCGDKASGFHYGVHACEGCKGFFRRSIQQKIQYRPCTKNQQCSVVRVNRNRCQYCRLKKCIEVGMSREAVRFGRVPKTVKEQIKAEMQKANAQSQVSSMAVELESDDHVIRSIIQAHNATCEFTQERFLPILDKFRLTSVAHNLTSSTACPLSADPDCVGLVRSMEFSERYSPAIRGVVDFAKSIPGFHVLLHQDKVALLKAGVFEVLLLRLACLFDPETRSLTLLNGSVYSRDSPSTLHGTPRYLIDSLFDFVERYNSLGLSDSEIAMFSALVLVCPERQGLRSQELVESMNRRLVEAMRTLLTVRHPSPGQASAMLHQLLMKLPDLRTLNTLHTERLLAFKMDPKEKNPAELKIQVGPSIKGDPSISAGTANALESLVKPFANLAPKSSPASLQLPTLNIADTLTTAPVKNADCDERTSRFASPIHPHNPHLNHKLSPCDKISQFSTDSGKGSFSTKSSTTNDSLSDGDIHMLSDSSEPAASPRVLGSAQALLPLCPGSNQMLESLKASPADQQSTHHSPVSPIVASMSNNASCSDNFYERQSEYSKPIATGPLENVGFRPPQHAKNNFGSPLMHQPNFNQYESNGKSIGVATRTLSDANSSIPDCKLPLNNIKQESSPQAQYQQVATTDDMPALKQALLAQPANYSLPYNRYFGSPNAMKPSPTGQLNNDLYHPQCNSAAAASTNYSSTLQLFTRHNEPVMTTQSVSDLHVSKAINIHKMTYPSPQPPAPCPPSKKYSTVASLLEKPIKPSSNWRKHLPSQSSTKKFGEPIPTHFDAEPKEVSPRLASSNRGLQQSATNCNNLQQSMSTVHNQNHPTFFANNITSGKTHPFVGNKFSDYSNLQKQPFCPPQLINLPSTSSMPHPFHQQLSPTLTSLHNGSHQNAAVNFTQQNRSMMDKNPTFTQQSFVHSNADWLQKALASHLAGSSTSLLKQQQQSLFEKIPNRSPAYVHHYDPLAVISEATGSQNISAAQWNATQALIDLKKGDRCDPHQESSSVGRNTLNQQSGDQQVAHPLEHRTTTSASATLPTMLTHDENSQSLKVAYRSTLQKCKINDESYQRELVEDAEIQNCSSSTLSPNIQTLNVNSKAPSVAHQQFADSSKSVPLKKRPGRTGNNAIDAEMRDFDQEEAQQLSEDANNNNTDEKDALATRNRKNTKDTLASGTAFDAASASVEKFDKRNLSNSSRRGFNLKPHRSSSAEPQLVRSPNNSFSSRAVEDDNKHQDSSKLVAFGNFHKKSCTNPEGQFPENISPPEAHTHFLPPLSNGGNHPRPIAPPTSISGSPKRQSSTPISSLSCDGDDVDDQRNQPLNLSLKRQCVRDFSAAGLLASSSIGRNCGSNSSSMATAGLNRPSGQDCGKESPPVRGTSSADLPRHWIA